MAKSGIVTRTSWSVNNDVTPESSDETVPFTLSYLR
jgi:hypothetical protein